MLPKTALAAKRSNFFQLGFGSGKMKDQIIFRQMDKFFDTILGGGGLFLTVKFASSLLALLARGIK